MNKSEKIIVAILGLLLVLYMWHSSSQSKKEAEARAKAERERIVAATPSPTPVEANASETNASSVATNSVPVEQTAMTAKVEQPKQRAERAEEQVVTLRNGKSVLAFSTHGATLKSATLLDYFENPDAKGPDAPRFKLDFKAAPALELSDVVSYHNYSNYAFNVQELYKLKKLGRPLLNTEWLHRLADNTVQELFPLFFLEKVGCWNWGLVAGLSQTYELWEGIWNAYEPGKPCGYDFTKWQHDLFRPSLRPYDPKEIELIQRFTALAAEEDASKTHTR